MCTNGNETYFPGETFKVDCNTWYGIHHYCMHDITICILFLHHSTCTDTGLVACTEIACTGKYYDRIDKLIERVEEKILCQACIIYTELHVKNKHCKYSQMMNVTDFHVVHA